jgi:hypothetical protein
MSEERRFDYVIAGGGSAGCVLAKLPSRLDPAFQAIAGCADV